MSFLVNKQQSTAAKTDNEEYAFHGLRKDADGLLYYTKAHFAGSDSVDLTDGTDIAFGGIEDVDAGTKNSSVKGTTDSGISEHENNGGAKYYDGSRFDNNKLKYYLNSNGFLVARYMNDYVSNDGQDGATENWKA